VSRLDAEVEICLFAFVFAAVVALALALIDEIPDRLQWWRLAAKVGAFGGFGYLTLVNVGSGGTQFSTPATAGAGRPGRAEFQRSSDATMASRLLSGRRERDASPASS
jgi:hypothetical protein